MAISVAQLQTHMDAARTYLVAENYAAARIELLAGMAVLAGLPDGGSEGASFSWRDTIRDMLKEVDAAIAEGRVLNHGVIRQTKIRYGPTTD